MLDVGLEGGALYAANQARSLANWIVGDLAVARVAFTYPGFHGGATHNLGFRGRPVLLLLTIRCASVNVLNAIAWNIDQSKILGEFQLTTSTGRVFQRAVLDSGQPAEPYDVIRAAGAAPVVAGWIRQDWRLQFTVWSAD